MPKKKPETKSFAKGFLLKKPLFLVLINAVNFPISLRWIFTAKIFFTAMNSLLVSQCSLDSFINLPWQRELLEGFQILYPKQNSDINISLKVESWYNTSARRTVFVKNLYIVPLSCYNRKYCTTLLCFITRDILQIRHIGIVQNSPSSKEMVVLLYSQCILEVWFFSPLKIVPFY